MGQETVDSQGGSGRHSPVCCRPRHRSSAPYQLTLFGWLFCKQTRHQVNIFNQAIQHEMEEVHSTHMFTKTYQDKNIIKEFYNKDNKKKQVDSEQYDIIKSNSHRVRWSHFISNIIMLVWTVC